MDELRFERRAWTATLNLTPLPVVPFADVVRAYGAVQANERLAHAELDLATGGPAPAHVAAHTPDGWSVIVSASSVIVEHRQALVLGLPRLPAESFPGRSAFLDAVRSLADSLPWMVSRCCRPHLMAEYVMHTQEDFPASWIGKLVRGSAPLPYAIPDGEHVIVNHHEMEFEFIDGQRCVWNDALEVSDWFGPDGSIQQNASIALTVSLAGAVPEPAGPVARYPGLETLPPLPADKVAGFLSAGDQVGLGRLIERVKKKLPQGVAFNE